MSEEREWKFRFDHMLGAIQEIEVYTKGADAKKFESDLLLNRAVERCFEIVGEAARKVPQSVQDRFPDVPWRKITGLRNILAHNYEDAKAGLIWLTIVNDLPPLKERLVAIVRQIQSEK